MNQSQATLLVVDDEPMNRDALSRRLEHRGYDVVTAASGPDALARMDDHRVDAVLLDVMMPGMSGLETLRRMREMRCSADLPIIMVTAKNASTDVVEALELGANDYVTKPIDFPVVLARIRTQVAARRADPLTGLATRGLFLDRLDRLVARTAGADETGFAVLFLDLDRFKTVNDSMGHQAGDELLVGIARRLEQSLRSTDTISRFGAGHTLARLGGDEFTILLEGVRQVADVKAVAARLQAAVAQPFLIQGRQVSTTASIGLVSSAPHYTHGAELVRDADMAMYRAKRRGVAQCELFEASMLAEAEERAQCEADLRHAVDRQELELHYQPIVSLASGEVTAFEALVRWRHARRGLLSPDAFMSIAEETGLIVPIGAWVLAEACRQMAEWDRQHPENADLIVNVNVSARQCAPGFPDEVASVLRATGLAPGRLKLELTESTVLAASETTIAVLERLRALGVRMGLDDFGTGYSALSYLPRLPFQTLKIDRSFIQGLDDSRNGEVVRAIIAMAASLNMDVTAEGIETADQMGHLKALACGSGQGFFFDRPLARGDVSRVFARIADQRVNPA